MTVRTTSFDPVGSGGSASEESLAVPEGAATSQFIGQELSKSDRPELASASVSQYLILAITFSFSSNTVFKSRL